MKAGGEQRGIVCSTSRCSWRSTNPFEGAVDELRVLSLLGWAHQAPSRAGDTTHTTATNPPCPFLLRTAEQKQFLTWHGEERATVQVRTCSLKADLGQTGLQILFCSDSQWCSQLWLTAAALFPVKTQHTGIQLHLMSFVTHLDTRWFEISWTTLS